MNSRALMPDDLVIVESAPEKIDTFSCKMTVPPSGHHNGFFFCTY
ncbi:phage tail protein [Salmonella enterica subsp. enterica]|nr:phage tail protein [Salmonella enterica subsp. enterica]EDR2887910.1 phage tail protein [Salmonella enterica subsp. enterica]EDR6139878.1 phage tail protein [Salmonella enterica subsp. enterica]EDU9859760.1 phage tail protein [Salmonella enterica subsp. enterica]EDV0529938.1 phage tail protein [Salmonella enterica subsp. enterica]